MVVPTAHLPPIRNITSVSRQDLGEVLEYLRNLYQPRVRGSRRRRDYSSAKCEFEVSEPQHLDPFERNYTIKWLCALISHLELRNFSVPDSDREKLIQSAASLVALCSGTSAAGTLYRDFTFRSNRASSCSVSVRIKDIPLNNQDYSSVGAQTWGGACVLSEFIVDEPWKFGLCFPDDAAPLSACEHTLSKMPPFHPLRILELGAGTGLVSLTTARLLETLISRYHASPVGAIRDAIDTPKQNMTTLVTIVATDCYPPVLENLDSNITANFANNTGGVISITSHPLDWANFASTYGSTSTSPPAPFDEAFDIILGADIVYELEHAAWIKSCLSILLKMPNARPISDVSHMRDLAFLNDADRLTDHVFHLVIPQRSTHVKESQTIEATFPYARCEHVVIPQHEKRADEDGISQTKSLDITGSQQLCILSRDVIVCDRDDDKIVTRGHCDEDEAGVTYLYYRIGWRNIECSE